VNAARNKSNKRAAPKRSKGDESAALAVYDGIRAALLNGLLPPGLKLQEPPIANALATSRERVRAALRRLAHEGWLELVPNRGAFVREITIEEIEDVTEARLVIERAAAERIVANGDATQLARLNAHVEKERRAAEKQDRAAQIALSSEFHCLICELAGNSRLIKFYGDLMSASQLSYALYAPSELPRCGGPKEHPEIVAAIAAGRADTAARLIAEHLRETPRHMRRTPRAAFAGFDTIFKPLARATRKTSHRGGAGKDRQ